MVHLFVPHHSEVIVRWQLVGGDFTEELAVLSIESVIANQKN